MSGLKTRVSKLVNDKFVYFSYADLVLIRDFFKDYLDDQDAVLKDYDKQCKELEACLEQWVKDKSCDYHARVNELAQNDPLAHYAYLHKIYVGICASHPTGWWVWETRVAEPFFTNLKAAKKHFEDKANGRN